MCIGFTVYFSLNWENVVAVGRFPVLKVVNFFSQIFIITQMRLKLTSLSLLDYQKMPKLIPHCSSFEIFNYLRNLPVSDFLISLI